jgi:hypothetical protein
MKKSALFLELILTLIAIIIIASCGSPTDNGKKDDKDSVTTEVPKIPADAIFLTGLYATSTNTPYDQYSPEFLFDGTEKYWATMPGAGPDEGVMMYFDNFDQIATMEIKVSNNEALGKILDIDVYINGSDVWSTKLRKSNIVNEFKDPVNSIYIRITEAEGLKTVKGQGEDVEYSVLSYSSAKSLGIEEIIFKDKSGKKLNIMPLKTLKGSVNASSTLSPVEAYSPDFLFDSRYDFGWAEGNKDGSGVGEKIDMTFDAEQNISKIKIWNGFQRSDAHYKSNARVKQFEFGTTGNMSSYTLKDEMTPQEIVLQKPIKAKQFSFIVKDIYPGASYKDMVISEIRFYTDYGWSVLGTDGPEKRKQDLVSKLKGSVMEKMTDHWYSEEKKEYWDFGVVTESSIILRSNQSFVIWVNEFSSNQDYEGANNVYDGNWELVNASKGTATIKIFGKRRVVTQGYGAYKGRQKTDQVTIFSDVLTITASSIKGEKFIDEIYLK